MHPHKTTHTPAVPPLCSCPCIIGTRPDIKKCEVFSELPACPHAHHHLTSKKKTHTHTHKKKDRKKYVRIGIRDDGGRIALHSLDFVACLGTQQSAARRNVMEETLPHLSTILFHTRQTWPGENTAVIGLPIRIYSAGNRSRNVSPQG